MGEETHEPRETACGDGCLLLVAVVCVDLHFADEPAAAADKKYQEGVGVVLKWKE